MMIYEKEYWSSGYNNKRKPDTGSWSQRESLTPHNPYNRASAWSQLMSPASSVWHSEVGIITANELQQVFDSTGQLVKLCDKFGGKKKKLNYGQEVPAFLKES